MRNRLLLTCSVLLALAGPAKAADALKFGPPPSWVVPLEIPPAPTALANAPIVLLLKDQQARLEPGKVTTFMEFALRIQNSDGLAAGNIALPWRPATDTVTVNKVHIIRDGKRIDVLGLGQTFTTVRRETNLEAAMLDGTLTAALQPEGLRVGDVVNVALTTEHVDPVLKGHVEGVFAGWNGIPIQTGHVRVSWPSNLDIVARVPKDLPSPVRTSKDGTTFIELRGTAVEPLLLPKAAPVRFAVVREAEFTDFQSWAGVSRLMIPLYRSAAVIPAAGPLRDELNRIRKEARTPAQRAEQALQLVQERVRYFALLMGAGGYVPASAETTWSRRFGDCKAKSALLLALLRELGIEADPVLVHSRMGDAIQERLPMIGYFDHVIVRAKLGGKSYWLDGTRTGDSSLAALEVPNFGWGLPVVEDAELVRILPSPLDRPTFEAEVDIDANGGVFAPAPFKGETILRGDQARILNVQFSSLSSAQLDQVLRELWKARHDYLTVETAAYRFDKSQAEMRVSAIGKVKLSWDEGWLFVPGSAIAYNPDFDRAAGPNREAPFAISYPEFTTNRTTIKLPAGFTRSQRKLPPPVQTILAGTEYARTVALNGDSVTVETSERSLVPEIAYAEAVAAQARIKALYDEDVYLRLPSSYGGTAKDIEARMAATPGSASGFIDRGLMLLNSGKFEEGIVDFTSAIELEPKNATALANRGIARVWKGDHAAAEKDLAAAEAIDPDNAIAIRARALTAERKGDFEAAAKAYSAALAKEPGSVFALLHRASVYRAMGEYAKALADTDQVLKAGYKNADLRLLRANLLRSQNDKPAVAAEAQALMAENPDNDYGFVSAGKIFAAIGRHREAMAAFDRALAIKPAAYVYINRAQARPETDVSGRLADLDTALKLEPDSIDALTVKAREVERGKDFKAALALYERAMAAAPDNEMLALSRAMVLQKLGRTGEAEKALGTMRGRMNTAAEFNNLCWTKATAGVMLGSALQDCRDALKLAPNDGKFLDSLGMVLLKLGRLEEALAAYDAAIADRTGASSYMGRAMVHQRRGDQARARYDIAQAIKLNPDVETEFRGYGLTADGQNLTVSK